MKDDVFMFDEDYQQQHLWNVAAGAKAERGITPGDYSVLGYNCPREEILFHRAPTPLIEGSDLSEVGSWTPPAPT